MPDVWSDRRDALPPGSVLREYRIQEVLGYGGFGIVYKARHFELEQVVAIKEYLPSELAIREGTVVRARGTDCETGFADGLRRFREEAKALIAFQQHPSIVDCHDFFRAQGTAYLVMEYVDGLPLSELLRQREAAGQPFTESDLLSIAVPLAQGLAQMHRAGVVHRDIKPANILVRRADQRPVLIDFGAAKQAVAGHSRSPAPYTEGYAALEQVGDGQIGPWTDLYGYGAVLWRMVAGGNPPWEPPNPVKVESRAVAHVRGATDPLPTAKELGAGRLAGELLDVIDGCMRLQDTERIGESERVVELLGVSGSANRVFAMDEPQSEGGTDSDQPDSVIEDPQPVRGSRFSLRKIAGLAAAITVAVGLAVAALFLSNEGVGFRFGRARAAELYMRACDGGDMYGCSSLITLADSYVKGEGVRQDLARAAELYERACSGGQMDGCSRLVALAKLYAKGGERVPEDPNRAAELYMRACDGGQMDGCSSLVTLADLYPEGQGVLQDRVRAAELYEGACGGGKMRGCTKLADLYAKGEGVRLDLIRAADLYEQACEDDDWWGCFGLMTLANRYYTGEGARQDRTRAADLYEQSCDGGQMSGCSSLGLMLKRGDGVRQDLAQAAILFKRTCEDGRLNDCFILGHMYKQGEGVRKSSVQAVKLFENACRDGNTISCVSLGHMHEFGIGAPKNYIYAQYLYEKACLNDNDRGCKSLERIRKNWWQE